MELRHLRYFAAVAKHSLSPFAEAGQRQEPHAGTAGRTANSRSNDLSLRKTAAANRFICQQLSSRIRQGVEASSGSQKLAARAELYCRPKHQEHQEEGPEVEIPIGLLLSLLWG